MGGCDGFFRESGFKEMLESKDFANLDNVSPILGAIKENCCGQSNKAPVTTVFSQYVRLINNLYR